MMERNENTDTKGAKRSAWVSTGEARELLGVSKRMLALLISKSELKQKRNIYDRRVKEILRADIERVLRDGVDGMRPPRRAATSAQVTTGGAGC